MALQQFVIEDDGFFCSGKYFQCENLGQEPYSAIMAAFSDLCDIVLQSSDFSDEWKTMIKEELGSDGKLLINSVTNISPFLDVEDEYQHYKNDANDIMHYNSVAKLKNACRSFVRAMCSSQRTVVIFIDDIQWMDEGSKEILEALLSDTNIRNFMLILAYRDNENFSIETLLESPVHIHLNINLLNLDQESMKKMVLKELSISSNLVSNGMDALCDLVVQRTQCNPFHVKQFFELIKAQKLLVYDGESCAWLFDVHSIQKRTMIAESLAQLLSKKINFLDNNTKNVLKRLSLLGYFFTDKMISDFCSDLYYEDDIGKMEDHSLQATLEKATEANFIEKTRDGYQFTHDKIHRSFQKIMDKTEKEKLHLMIGYKFVERPNLIFQYTAAIHFNCAISHFSDDVEGRHFLAKVNWKASSYCESRYAFADALTFIRQGLEVLGKGDEKWLANFELACAMTESVAKLEFILGDSEACRRANRDILNRDSSEKAKDLALFREVNCLAFSEDSNMYAVGKEILNKLGMCVPQIITPLHFLAKLRKVRKMVQGEGEQRFLNLPRMNPDLTYKLRTIMHLFILFMKQKKLIMGFYTDLLAVEFTVAHGLCIYSAMVIYKIARIEMMLGQEEQSYRMMKLSLQLVRDAPSHVAGFTYVLNAFICQRERVEMTDLIRFTPERLNDFLDRASIVNSLVYFVFSALLRLWSGEHLASIERSMVALCKRLHILDQHMILAYYQVVMQFVFNIRNKDETHWEKLTDVVFSGSVPLHRYMDILANFYQLFLSHTFGFYNKAKQSAKKIHLDLFLRKGFLSFPVYFFTSLNFFKLYEITRHRRYLHKAREFQKIIRDRHFLGNRNATPCSSILEAVELSLKPNISWSKVRTTFDVAIEIQRQERMTHLEALANELAGFTLSKLENGEAKVSRAYLSRAMEVYHEYGAFAKCRW
eukprot:CAMPEP_0178919804 /NCGR_PEP_ID=MMETSP0786-20121207/14644_1 /TAXON_ID=186022 /ORGANISM="Thalassionema frauenfeldii, Strain CCMP 1798" /LENGTH=935 /DNA_ID=CAMNT_0020593783 /DNA_START=182 /DNA_END=2986 /DNA_ORIENTATION=-